MYLQKVLLFLTVLFSISAVSCSSSEGESAVDSHKTLRRQAENLLTVTNWSEEIESNRLTEAVEIPSGISSSVKLSPLVLNASDSVTEKIYPDLEGFGSLNVSAMPPEVKKLVRNFASAFCKNEETDQFMASSSKYELGLLYKDLTLIFEQKSEDEPLFDSFIIGMEIQNNFICEVPLRFNKGKKSVDLTVYCKICRVEEKDVWLIDGFDILRIFDGGEVKNGK